MEVYDQKHGLPEPATHGGSTVDITDNSKAAKASVLLQDLRETVDEIEFFARSLTAIKKRSQFKIVR